MSILYISLHKGINDSKRWKLFVTHSVRTLALKTVFSIEDDAETGECDDQPDNDK